MMRCFWLSIIVADLTLKYSNTHRP